MQHDTWCSHQILIGGYFFLGICNQQMTPICIPSHLIFID
jgi:hypothetical protein